MKYLIVVSVMLGICLSAEAGLVITKKRTVKFGTVMAKGNTVRLKFTMGKTSGKIDYEKQSIIWYTTHEKVTNCYLGAKYAYAKKEYKVAKFLAEQAIKNEPENKKKAEELIIFINKLDKIGDDGDDY